MRVSGGSAVGRIGGWAALVVAAAVVLWILLPLPADLLAPASAPSVTLLDRDGAPLRTTRAGDGSRSTWASLEEIDPRILLAFIALEDQRFQRHHGVDIQAVARAARDNLATGRVVSGASTITMQLARLLKPDGRTFAGKISQTLWALRLEAHAHKQDILEQYLNLVPLGQGAVGVRSAAALYFDAPASRVSLGQAALLASLARSPSVSNPFVAPGSARTRRALALERMVEAGYVSAPEAGRAAMEPVLPEGARAAFLAPHFTTRVLSEVAPKPGDPSLWHTSLDTRLQREIEAEVRHTVDVMASHGARHAAAVVLDNRTGEVLSWVGSPDFWADSMGQVDMVVSRRQPGSALKPFLYGLAIERGYTPASILADIPKTYRTGTGVYRPRNYDRTFHGPVRLREALASSYNVPAVELADRMGAGALLHTLHLAGFESLTEGAEYYGIGLALGNGDVSLVELANGYRTFANSGLWKPWRWAVGAGEAGRAGVRVFSGRTAAFVLDMLSDPLARAPGFGLSTPFNDLPFPMAVKTGTSRHFTDNWAVGVTEGFTVAVWVGNFSGQPMNGISGVTGAGPLLRRAALLTASRYQPGAFATPAANGAVAREVCRHSGLLASPGCATLVEWFVPGTEPTRVCDWHTANGLRYPAEYAEWAGQQGLRDIAVGGVPEPDAKARPAGFHIVSPQNGDRYQIPPGVGSRFATIPLRVEGPAAKAVKWSVNGQPVAGERWQLAKGTHHVRAVSGGVGDEVVIEVQ